MSESVTVAVAYGDGIGPEIMQATLHILKEAKANIKIQTIEIGQKLYNKHYTSGINQEAWDTIANSQVLLKSPITTPQGSGYKSLNVTLRKALGLYANVRPARCFHPFVATKHAAMDLVIVRENQEDIYAGIEYRHTRDVYESVKLISKSGSQKIIRYAFEYARLHGRKKVTCLVKDNIMKFTDGIFHKTFDQMRLEYPELEADCLLMDIGTAKIASQPEMFDVIVTSNLYGDIISDVAAEISGSVGLAGSSNIGPHMAMFEAVHGSAPDIAGKGIANPSGLINAAVMMLVHLQQPRQANLIENAWKRTLEDGICTLDVYKGNMRSQMQGSMTQVSTMEFAAAVVARLGLAPQILPKANYEHVSPKANYEHVSPKAIGQIANDGIIDSSGSKKLVGVDVFIDMLLEGPGALAEKIQGNEHAGAMLQMITTKGLKVWPNAQEVKISSDHWCCRFIGVKTHQETLRILQELADKGIDFIKVEHLYEFDGVKGYSLAQGE
jgi:isocitrate dehydrogenase